VFMILKLKLKFGMNSCAAGQHVLLIAASSLPVTMQEPFIMLVTMGFVNPVNLF
jgi:hypothetical protein